MTHIESRPSTNTEWDYDFSIDFENANEENVKAFTAAVQTEKLANIISNQAVENEHKWFPRRMRDLDSFAEKVLEFGEELDADHPGFKDPVYRKRRQAITLAAKKYRTGQPLPHVDYTEEEIKTWGTVYKKLTTLYKTHACKQHNYVFPLLEQNCGYSPDSIPQLAVVSEFLQDCTGWQLRPVMGLLSSRDFLNAFAFRVFHSTQYIRHHSKPYYTPEPDVCHELLGHVPLFCDPEFAAFSQYIGLASLGASDEDIEKLATLYWFTIEFGLCREGDKVKAYGAGLLSSFGELEYCLSDKPEHVDFDPQTVSGTKYPITEYQERYFVCKSFEDAKKKLREYAKSLKRPFEVKYNPYTQRVEVINTKEQLTSLAGSISADMELLKNAIAVWDGKNM
eukprot:CAMPEP_0168533850 /NCGR_PEP_ID=MMETSP0405-20121227/17428_1 /TAXON_ID=498012 /ORGANISM="Trichosphaerium sp, Strain Am-I-7 wt" /LENGTH=393 /DNA_ID=CAMNT_0008560201 /DNA_START=86 /DNA_END=1267 /DNA_ORIENTATION=+